MQIFPVGGPQNCTTARRHNASALQRQLVNDRGFDITKPLFALTLKILTD
jgi:hypothetical protein